MSKHLNPPKFSSSQLSPYVSPGVSEQAALSVSPGSSVCLARRRCLSCQAALSREVLARHVRAHQAFQSLPGVSELAALSARLALSRRVIPHGYTLASLDESPPSRYTGLTSSRRQASPRDRPQLEIETGCPWLCVLMCVCVCVCVCRFRTFSETESPCRH